MARFSDFPQYSERYDRAVQFALSAHRHQQRKHRDLPYILHPQAVASYVWLQGGSESEAIAGWLHDYAEDVAPSIEAGLHTLEVEFGAEVAAIVRGCTECDRTGSWKERKQRYIQQVASSSDSVLRVSLADKYDNFANGYLSIGKSRPELIWFGSTLAEIYQQRLQESWLTRQFAAVVERLKLL